MSVETEAAEAATPETYAPEGSVEPATGAESTAPDQSSGSDEQVAALRERIDALEGGSQAQAQSLPDDASFVDYLANVAGADEGDEDDPSAYDYGQPAGQPADESEEIVAELDAYISQQVQARLDPVLSSIQRDQQESQLRGLATKYPDLRSPQMLDAIGARLGPLADSRQDQALLTDPKLVEMAYLAAKAEAVASAENPAQPGTGAAVETGSASAPEPSVTPEEQFLKSVVGAGSTENPFL